MSSPNDYCRHNSDSICLGIAIDCTRDGLRGDLTIEEMEIGAVEECDGRVSEIGINSLINRIRSWSKLKRYQLTRGRRLAGDRFSSAPPNYRSG
jgi:hypothetical protein